jgi:hypothetical protein
VGSNHRPSGYEPDELPLLYFAMWTAKVRAFESPTKKIRILFFTHPANQLLTTTKPIPSQHLLPKYYHPKPTPDAAASPTRPRRRSPSTPIPQPKKSAPTPDNPSPKNSVHGKSFFASRKSFPSSNSSFAK